MSEPKKWLHDDLARDLAAQLRGNGERLVWTDMQLGPSGSPRPDVYTLPLSYSRFTPLSFECKISVSDFRRDVTSGKWQSYLTYSSGVIFAVPAGLIKKEDVPAGCGLYTRSENGWRAAKGATLRHIETLPHEAWMKLLIDGVKRARQGPPESRILNFWMVNQELRRKFGDEIADLLSSRENARVRLEMALLELNKQDTEVRAEMEERNQRIKARIEQELQSTLAAKRELCVALGLAETVSSYGIQNQVRRIIGRLDENEEIRRLSQALNNVRRTLENSLAPLLPDAPIDEVALEERL